MDGVDLRLGDCIEQMKSIPDGSVDLVLTDPKNRNTRLFVSFSGGRTSAYMTYLILKYWSGFYDEIIVLFANSGKEDERTLRFIKQCDDILGFNTIWLEANVSNIHGKGTTHRIVNFETASRHGEPFEDVIKKYGIPNKNFPHCTRELKQRPMYSYIRSLGWKNRSFDVAIGIRRDEIDRMSVSASENCILYPLVKWGITKKDVLHFWKNQPFDLYLPEHFGNCDFCWKKSLRKHLTLAVEAPDVFEFPARMERMYGFTGAGTNKNEPRVFFREKRSTEDLINLSKQPFDRFIDENASYDPTLDIGGGCGESCEIFADDFLSADMWEFSNDNMSPLEIIVRRLLSA